MISIDQIEHASVSDVGVRRNQNQDAHATLLAKDDDAWREQGHVFMVADGLGAQAVGELASAIAVGVVPLLYQKYTSEGMVLAFQKAFAEANETIHERGRMNPDFAGMGTTCTTLVIRPDGAWIGHVGDSRCYRIRNGKIEQLSFDHSLLWETAKREGLKPEEIANIPSNIIVRSLGPMPEVEADIYGPHQLQVGDIFLLCSDGLSGPLSDPEIGAVASALPPEEACQFLVDLTNLRGGPDNITVLIARVKPGTGMTVGPTGSLRDRLMRYWPFGVLLLGFCLAAFALYLTSSRKPGGGYVLLITAVALLTGIIGFIRLVLQQLQEKARLERQPDYEPQTKIYREADCQIDAKLVNKLAKAEAGLVEHGREHKWEANWKVHKQHLDQEIGRAHV